jgi:uncharacterized coiled-coil DUF342 family protein
MLTTLAVEPSLGDLLMALVVIGIGWLGTILSTVSKKVNSIEIEVAVIKTTIQKDTATVKAELSALKEKAKDHADTLSRHSIKFYHLKEVLTKVIERMRRIRNKSEPCHAPETDDLTLKDI